MKAKTKKILIWSAIILTLVAIGIGIWYWQKAKKNQADDAGKGEEGTATKELPANPTTATKMAVERNITDTHEKVAEPVFDGGKGTAAATKTETVKVTPETIQATLVKETAPLATISGGKGSAEATAEAKTVGKFAEAKTEGKLNL